MALWARIVNDKVAETVLYNENNVFNSGTYIQVPVNLEPYVNNDYIVVNGVVQPPTLGYLKSQLMALVSDWRWNKQVNGVVEYNSFQFGSRDEDRAAYGQAVQLGQAFEALNAGQTFTTPWKAKNGFTNLNLNDLIAISMLVGQHITQCFGLESSIGDAIQDAIDGADAEIENMLEAFHTLTEIPVPEEIAFDIGVVGVEAPTEHIDVEADPLPELNDNLSSPAPEVEPLDPEVIIPVLPEVPNDEPDPETPEE